MIVVFTGDTILHQNARNQENKIDTKYEPRVPTEPSMRGRVQMQEQRKGTIRGGLTRISRAAINTSGIGKAKRRRCCFSRQCKNSRRRCRRRFIRRRQRRLQKSLLPLEYIKRVAVDPIQLEYIVDEEIILDEIVEREQEQTGTDCACVEDGQRLLELEGNTGDESGA